MALCHLIYTFPSCTSCIDEQRRISNIRLLVSLSRVSSCMVSLSRGRRRRRRGAMVVVGARGRLNVSELQTKVESQSRSWVEIPVTCYQLLGAICKLRHYTKVIELYKAMDSQRINVNIVTYDTLINCYCEIGQVDLSLAVIAKIYKNGFELNNIIFTTLLKGLLKEDKVINAVQLFDKMIEGGYGCDAIKFA
ncbi:hypothetical protein GIB67_003484 [Kingdonia uniflora]|uniref:Pentatricopeptide repeat-containing protein n=1 Tax=Kingdonia uniflora TaxID=39325 RepID=A0A7J7MEX1_9MAGN|nr:hypothetical protein GIB67_003484 [Kingdonia uniflora]